MKNLFLIDASGYIYRAFFAIQGMSNREGQSTGALFGFIRTLFKLREQFKPDLLVSIFDGPNNKASRTTIYPEYKAHRPPASQDLIDQMIEAEQFCQLAGVSTIRASGVEADDTIASVALWGKEQGYKVFIVSQDKDLCQLVDDQIQIINPAKDNLLVDRARVEEQFGIPPESVQDYLAIMGDSSDNVPGISGFGPKTAIELIKKYGTLENILAHAKEIPGKKGQTLISEHDIALLSKKLVALDRHVPFTKEEQFFLPKEPDFDALKAFFEQKQFHSLLKTLPKRETVRKTAYHIVQDEGELRNLVKELSIARELCLDTETTSERPLLAKLVGIGLARDTENAYYIPVNGALSKELVLSIVKPLLESKEHSFFGHNIKYDLHVLQNEGITVQSLSFDTMLASYLLNAHERRHSLDELTQEYFGVTKIPTTDLIGTGKKAITMMEVPIERVGEYCCEDVEYTYRLKIKLQEELQKRGLEHLLYDIELPLTFVLKKMEETGVYVDLHYLHGLKSMLGEEIHKLEESIFALAGETFNLNSPKQLSEILYNKLLIPPLKKSKTGLSTAAEVLETLAVTYPIAALILEYRSLEKLRSTYVETLPHEINPKTHRVHCTFNQSVAATGRLSCQDPNLQNIPVRTPLGRKIREAFRPQKSGWSYISGDYSQIELRLLAHVAEDEGLISAFEKGLDVHAYTAAQIFHVPIEEVTSEMRHRAKAVNFGIIYGQQAFGLSKELHVSMKEASQFIEEYLKRYPRVQAYIDHMKMRARETGKAVTLTGRERLIPEINSPNQMLKSQAERLAINTPLQGTAADLIKIAMLKIDEWMKKEKFQSKMILQIHDELIFEAIDEEIDRLKTGIKFHMENVFDLKIPLVVEIAIGKNWKEC